MKDIISREEMVGCSCVGKHPFSDIEWVIREACIHQAEHTTKMIKEKIETLKNRPSQYHYVCWASGTVKVKDKWGCEETYKCDCFDGDFNCGHRGCKDGLIKGYRELTDKEKHENWMLQKILDRIRGET